MRVHVVAPDGFADPARPSGGNIYDRRVCAGLAGLGWDVRVATVAGAWPHGDRAARFGLERVITAIPDGATVLIDGLVASASAPVLLPHSARLRLTVLLHMPLATALDGPADTPAKLSERAVLGAADAVVVTSEWTRGQVLARFSIPPDRVHVALPGVDRPDADRGDGVSAGVVVAPGAGHLLCVGTPARHKGQDVLVQALAGLADADWDCVLAGPLDRDPGFVAELRARVARLGLGRRVRLTGTLAGTALDHAYAAADLLVVPSRADTYGMVIGEALVRGLPVVATETGGLPEALGRAPDGARPGRLVPPDDPRALGAALGRWLRDPAHRRHLRAAARARVPALPTWSETTRTVAAALTASRRPRG